MKKILIIIFVIIVGVIGFIYLNKDNRFYLEDKYYNNNEFINIDANSYNDYKNDSYILFTFNNYCNLPIPCEEIFKSFIEKNNIAILYIPFEEFKNIDLYNHVKYAPSIIVVNKGKMVAYLDAEKDDDLIKYQDENAFEEWISKYIYIKK